MRRGERQQTTPVVPVANATVNVTELVNLLAAANAANRDNQKVDIEKFLKFHPTNFKGTADPRLAEQWIDEVEAIFE